MTATGTSGISRRLAALAAVAGLAALTMLSLLKVGAIPALPAKVALGAAIPVAFVAALLAMKPAPARGRLSARWPFAEQTPGEDEAPGPMAREDVQAWRHARLMSLGIGEETAILLAAAPTFSVHALEGLLRSGCPLDTALRILWPV